MSSSSEGLRKGVRLRSATALVVANMIGAGIFTTTGFQAADLGHPGIIFALWILGGLLALCGAMCFAELGAAMPRAGGEYVYLRETYGPALGFMTAFISIIAGFSAPIAVALKSFVRYLSHFIPQLASVDPVPIGDLVAVALVWILVAVHLRGVKGGVGFNDLVTLFKVCGIVLILVATLVLGRGDASNIVHVAPKFSELSTVGLFAAMGTSLIFVNFCYLGWNAAAYMAAEMYEPKRDLPRALILGTLLVTVLYLGLNLVYFYGAPAEELAGKLEVGLVAGRNLFGDTGVSLMTLVLCTSIFASASAMTIVGPRVYYAFGLDFHPMRKLSETLPSTGAPGYALILQGVVTSIIIFSGRVDQILQYAGFTLSLFSSLAVSCVIVLRIKRPTMERPFRTWGYPITPILFLTVSAWTMYWAMRGRPVESLLAFATVAAGGLLFYATSRK